MRPLDYLQFELHLSAHAAGVYIAAVLHSPAGEAVTQMTWPWSSAHFAQQLQTLQTMLTATPTIGASQFARSFGEMLFRSLFDGDVGACFEASKATARTQGKGLRINLRIDPPALLGAPWELLFDPRAAEFIALTRDTPLVRYLAVPQPIQPLAVTPPLRILGLAASPPGVPKLDLVQERLRLDQALAPVVGQGRAEVVWLPGQDWRTLQQSLQGDIWHMIHFVGHAFYDAARGEGTLLLAGEDGAPWPLGATELARLLDRQPGLRLVVLNACEGARGDEQQAFSSLGAALVRRGLPAVIAMQYPISDRAALEFSRSFYGALAAGLPVEAATGEARKAMSLSTPYSLEWLAPVLFLRASDGRLWDGPAGGEDHAPTDATRRAQQALPMQQEVAPQANANIQIGGSVSGSTIITGSDNQVVTGGASAPTTSNADDARWFEEQFEQLRFALRTLRGQMDRTTLQMAELQLKLLQGEFAKSSTNHSPDVTEIVDALEWLLKHVPDLTQPLRRFLRAPVTRRALEKTGPGRDVAVQRLYRFIQ
jgi:hypothetical protein